MRTKTALRSQCVSLWAPLASQDLPPTLQVSQRPYFSPRRKEGCRHLQPCPHPVSRGPQATGSSQAAAAPPHLLMRPQLHMPLLPPGQLSPAHPFAAQDMDQETVPAPQIHKGLPGAHTPLFSLLFPQDLRTGKGMAEPLGNPPSPGRPRYGPHPAARLCSWGRRSSLLADDSSRLGLCLEGAGPATAGHPR